MNNNAIRIDLVKLIKFGLRRLWVLILCAAVGFGIRYWITVHRMPDTYTASGTMYVYNSNPNLVNYQYASSVDLDSAVKLIDTYMIVVKSNKVMEVVTDRLAADYPGITPGFIASSLHMSSLGNRCRQCQLRDCRSKAFRGYHQCSAGCGSGRADSRCRSRQRRSN